MAWLSTTSMLCGICVIQFLVIVFLIGNNKAPIVSNEVNNGIVRNKQPSRAETAAVVQTIIRDKIQNAESQVASKLPMFGGVAMTMFLHAPTWFQRRCVSCSLRG
jgi:hypothetical protein